MSNKKYILSSNSYDPKSALETATTALSRGGISNYKFAEGSYEQVLTHYRLYKPMYSSDQSISVRSLLAMAQAKQGKHGAAFFNYLRVAEHGLAVQSLVRTPLIPFRKAEDVLFNSVIEPAAQKAQHRAAHTALPEPVRKRLSKIVNR